MPLVTVDLSNSRNQLGVAHLIVAVRLCDVRQYLIQTSFFVLCEMEESRFHLAIIFCDNALKCITSKLLFKTTFPCFPLNHITPQILSVFKKTFFNIAVTFIIVKIDSTRISSLRGQEQFHLAKGTSIGTF